MCAFNTGATGDGSALHPTEEMSKGALINIVKTYRTRNAMLLSTVGHTATTNARLIKENAELNAQIDVHRELNRSDLHHLRESYAGMGSELRAIQKALASHEVTMAEQDGRVADIQYTLDEMVAGVSTEPQTEPNRDREPSCFFPCNPPIERDWVSEEEHVQIKEARKELKREALARLKERS